jgi:hypothetical protein
LTGTQVSRQRQLLAESGLSEAGHVPACSAQPLDAPLSDGKPMTQVTVPVTNLEDVLALVMEAGGSVVEPTVSIPGVGWYATCEEPGGLNSV